MGQWGACARKRLFDVHGHFSLTCSVRFGYGSPRGVAAPHGEIGGGRERPPLFASRIGKTVPADVHWRAIALGGRSRLNYPCGKAPEKISEDLLVAI